MEFYPNLSKLRRRTVKNRTLALVLGFALFGVSGAALAGPKPKVDPRFDYLGMFVATRKVMTRKPARVLLNSLFAEQLKVNPDLAAKYGFNGKKIKAFTETQFMMLLQEVPSIRPEVEAYLKAVPKDADLRAQTPQLIALREKWKTRFQDLFKDKKLLEKFFARANPFEPFLIEGPPGSKGFGPIKTYITHAVTLKDGTVRAADDVEKAIVEFINEAESEIRFNVFDFDLDSIADALIAAKKRGVDVMGGIDKGVYDTRPEVRAIYKKLTDAGIHVQLVDSVGLNHQKLIVSDWTKKGKGRVLTSEGNFTKSCISKDGDVAGTPYHSTDSVPNANLANVYESDEMAAVVHHDLTKTVDPEYALRGDQYPVSGAWKVMGEAGVGGKERSVVLAFSPNGGLDGINQNFIARAIRESEGPIYLAQFAFSSPEVENALLEKAIETKKAGKKFNLFAVGDTPFAMQDWSVTLNMAGLKLVGEGDKKNYVKIPDEENKWLQALGKDDYAELLQNLRIAPPVYGTHNMKTPEGNFQITAKLHHKLMCIGVEGAQICIYGSFNFSTGAESNQEYIIAVLDDEFNELGTAVVTSLSKETVDHQVRTVVSEANRRNVSREFDPAYDDQVDNQKAGKPMKRQLARACAGLVKPGAAPLGIAAAQ